MKFLSEYRNRALIGELSRRIGAVTNRPWTIMEVCGGQTHAIVKFGLEQFLPEGIELVHGPGCPVCVTPLELIDKAIDIASRKEVIFCSFGDMLRVPGSDGDLLRAKSAGAEVRVVYSPMDALKIAVQNPGREVVFLAVGFETTAPANAMAAYQAKQKGIENFSMLVSHFLVPPAIEAICSSPQSRVNGFLAAGHVCTIMGYRQYAPLVKKYQVPIVVTGFEPVDILEGVLHCVAQLERGSFRVENQYARSVRRDGNRAARDMMKQVFEVREQNWRGVGTLSRSGLKLRAAFSHFDAELKFQTGHHPARDTGCISGQIMQGLKKPHDCPHFGTTCVPEYPLGAPMVSSEGACAAYYRYRSRTAETSR